MSSSNAIVSKIDRLAGEWQGRGVEVRRHLHQYPEIGYHEEKTSAYVVEQLVAMGLAPRRIAGTGVLLELGDGAAPPAVALRVDIDALPIQEMNETPYASKVPGMMHACGHDAHAAIGLGVAHVLHALEEELPGPIRILFQPAEESTPGGALAMIRSGAIEGIRWIFGVHVDPDIEVGKVGIRYGAALASTDSFEIEILAKGGHAAHPHRSVDAVLVAAHVVDALHQIVSRRINPVKPAVISIATIHGGEADNVLPDSVRMSGTFRTLDNDVHQQVPKLMEETIAGITHTFGADYRLLVTPGAPVLVNHREPTERMEEAASDVLGSEYVVRLEFPRMGAEDFAQYTQRTPGSMIRLGVASGPQTSYSLHSSRFDIDERAIEVGVRVLAWTLLHASDHLWRLEA